MKIQSCLKAALFSVITLTAATAIAQTEPAPDTQPTPKSDTKVDLVYTGRMLGYFRVPSLQKFSEANGCPAEGQLQPSEAAKVFLTLRDQQDKSKMVLVGTGDNFAPELEARMFADPPHTADKYDIANKELYWGSNSGWEFYKDVSPGLRTKIANGLGVIPNDNVACFLRRASYAAIVPGKHDFYFGAERVRQFARFLAKGESGRYQPVQMLGANLVMKTVPIESPAESKKARGDRSFVDWPVAYPVLNLKDGKSVYPWFSLIKIQLAEMPSEARFLEDLKKLPGPDGTVPDQKLRDFIAQKSANLDRDLANAKAKQTVRASEILQLTADQKRLSDLKLNLETIRQNPIRICASTGDPNELPDDQKGCDETQGNRLGISGNKVVLNAYLKEKFKGKAHSSTLEYGKNFGLCTITEIDNPRNKAEKMSKNACMRFSSHIPFFYFPHHVPNEDGNSDGYDDPEPYALKNDVAIFGVVDPTLGEQVGILNFGWRHDNNPELTTRLNVEDPADALQQQLDYFAIKQPTFSGLKVLLAQMSPQRARALAARFPEFQIVVAAADQEQATSNLTLSTLWEPEPPANDTFLAVPAPYFNPATRKGSVQYGIITAEQQKGKWGLSAQALKGLPVVEPEDDPAEDFWARVKALPGCLDSDFNRTQANETYSNQTYLKWLVLCSMQKHLGADVALIQARDLFEKIPKLAGLINRTSVAAGAAERDENLQQTLDRLIWKGDLVTLIYVPGSALKKALDQSDVFATTESATLSLSPDRGRTLETLGIRTKDGEYFINELPLDSSRLYAVATTDYIGAGDTGYPDLANAARNPRTHPAAYSGELISISSLVCRRLFANDQAEIEKYCLGPVDGNSYLDETTAQQIPPYPPDGKLTRLWAATGIALPKQRTESHDPADGLEHTVQRRSFRAFSLKSFTIGFKDLDNNRTDQSLQDRFAGISTSGVGSKENRTISVGLDTRFSYFSDKHEWFLGLGADYERQSTGDPTKATGISLNKNKLFLDGGLVFWRHPGRELPNLGAVLSIHTETQPEAPFSAFNLNTDAKEQIRITQKRGLLALGRLGLRWQNRNNAAEVGAQFGREFRALRGYHFENPGDNDPECLVTSTQTLGDCINEKSKTSAGLILPTSTPSALLQGRPRAGIYWNHKLSFPIWSKMKYEVTQDADFFFVKFHRDTSIDTRFRYNSKNSLGFMIWPNFSIGPTLELLMYQNKGKGNFLFQRTLGIEMKFNFDILNRREKLAQIRSRE